MNLPEYFVHFGHDKLEKSKFNEITDKTYCGGLKPKGGLWGSNEEGYGWREWAEDEKYYDKPDIIFSKSFKFKIKNGYKVLVITKNELDRFRIGVSLATYPYLQSFDWLKIKSEYDAVYIPAGSNEDLYMKYYGWDCDSILVLNYDAIEVIEDVSSELSRRTIDTTGL